MFRTDIEIQKVKSAFGKSEYRIYERKWYRSKMRYVHTVSSVDEAYEWISDNYLYYNIADIK